jgi:hypothetical protein
MRRNGFSAKRSSGAYSESVRCRNSYTVTINGAASRKRRDAMNLIEFARTMEALLEALNDAPSIIKGEVDRYFSNLSDSSGC